MLCFSGIFLGFVAWLNLRLFLCLGNRLERSMSVFVVVGRLVLGRILRCDGRGRRLETLVLRRIVVISQPSW